MCLCHNVLLLTASFVFLTKTLTYHKLYFKLQSYTNVCVYKFYLYAYMYTYDCIEVCRNAREYLSQDILLCFIFITCSVIAYYLDIHTCTSVLNCIDNLIISANI